jgi:nucleoside-diphosphate-sugar epimerase
MKLFVFGFGYTSQRFVDLFGKMFATISGTVREADKRDALRAGGLDVCLFDPSDNTLRAHIADTDVILVSVPPGRTGDPVLAAFSLDVAASTATRVIYLSTIGVYGNHDGAWIDEDTPLAPQAERAQARIAAEQRWRNLVGDRLSILRLAGIYGPGRSPLTKLRDGTARRIVKPGQVFNRIHVDDAARAIKAAVALPYGGAWNVCDDEPAPPQDVVTYAASLMKLTPPPEQDFATAEMTPMGRSFYAASNRVSNARLKNELGVTLAFPTYREGLSSLVDAQD